MLNHILLSTLVYFFYLFLRVIFKGVYGPKFVIFYFQKNDYRE